MSRQFSIPTILRMVPNDLLREFFERLGFGDLDADWGDLREREIEPLIKTLSALPRDRQDQIEGALRNVFDLACEPGIGAIFEGAARCDEPDLAKTMPQGAGHYASAMWTWLHRPKAFEKALLIYQVDNLSWWRKRNDLPSTTPDLSESARAELVLRIEELLTWEQGRGMVCTVESFSRRDTVYFFAYPDDFVQNVVAHDDDGQLEPRTFRQTFAIVFAYNHREGTLELYAKVPAKLKKELEIIFARTILHHELGTWEPEAAYELDHLKESTFTLTTNPIDRLRVSIRKMRLSLKNCGRRILIEVDDDDPDDNIHRAIADCLNQERVPLSNAHVTLVNLCFEFLPLEGRKPGRMSFDVGYPRSCGLRSDRQERVDLVQKYLKRWRIDRVQPAAIVHAAAGK